MVWCALMEDSTPAASRCLSMPGSIAHSTSDVRSSGETDELPQRLHSALMNDPKSCWESRGIQITVFCSNPARASRIREGFAVSVS